MDYKVYYVGEIPGGAMSITVLDQSTGLPANLATFNSARLVMLDSNNNEVFLEDSATSIANPAQGRVVFVWPQESIFTKPGEYVFQLEFRTPSAVVKTDVQTILVKKLGGTR